MKLNLHIYIGIAVLAILLLGVYLSGPKADASSFPGVASSIATTSPISVTPTALVVFATSSCAARIISTTVAGGIMIGFSDNQGFVPSALTGFWQAASTTVTYDSGQYGCGAVRVYSGTPQTITVSESR